MNRIAPFLLSFFLLTFFAETIAAESPAPNQPAADLFQIGFSKVDITPEHPVRLSGYGNRAKPFTGVDEKLYVRAMAIGAGADQPLNVLVSVETIGFPGSLSQQIFEAVKAKHGLERSQLALCFTHNHTAPHIHRGLSNLFDKPLTDEEQQGTIDYTKRVKDLTVEAIDSAVADMQPSRFYLAKGEVKFARNRRVIKNGKWMGFGVTPGGPVDHGLPVLRVVNADGGEAGTAGTRGLIFNYACHCTTFGGNYNRVNGDWAGYAMKFLEEDHAGATVMCTIGCGADANPQRNPDRGLELAKSQGREISTEVNRLLEHGDWMEIRNIDLDPRFAFGNRDADPLLEWGIDSSFGYAGLPIDRPDESELKKALENPRSQVRRHAQIMLDTKKRMGRLPETYPMPIQVWRFGPEFEMVFLGGEVCVDYAFKIRDQLAGKFLKKENIWVSAYANDVFGYVVPERMRHEGGYEVDFSMIYYLQPGRWSTGTEATIMRKINELVRFEEDDQRLSPDQALSKFSVPADMDISILAAEPLIRDPINFCVDARGRMWVVEMGDYPRGNPADVDSSSLVNAQRNYTGDEKPWDDAAGGRIKILTDSSGDGTYDQMTVFLDGLKFPTGVTPWKDGVIVSSAPDIFFARDIDGDDQCDEQTVLYSGFEEANPQHRINGFEWGIDGWLYLAAGNHNNATVTSVKTGQSIETSGRDIRIEPESGAIEAISGASQWGRCQDEVGNWYGNDNYRPLYQFVIEERFLKRNPYVASPTPRAYLTDPANSPPVYPTSRTVDRYNDLSMVNKFTSACSPTVFKNSRGEKDFTEVLVCEPVHNLISRIKVDRTSFPFSGSRFAEEQQSEFLSSSDNWFRPVRIMSAPNKDIIWVCDMYRQVIEHPEWIPEAWQKSLDLYAGSECGRIYAVSKKETNTKSDRGVEDLSRFSNTQLVLQLLQPNGWRRETAQRLLLERLREKPGDIDKLLPQFERIVLDQHVPTRCRIQAMWTLSLIAPDHLEVAQLVSDKDANVVINTIQSAGLNQIADNAGLMQKLARHENKQVKFEFALALGDLPPEKRTGIEQLAAANIDDPWISAAVLSSSVGSADSILAHLFKNAEDSPARTKLAESLISTVLGDDPKQGFLKLLESLDLDVGAATWQMQAVSSALRRLRQSGTTIQSLRIDAIKSDHDNLKIVNATITQAIYVGADQLEPTPRRVAAIRLAGHYPNFLPASSDDASDVSQQLSQLMLPQNETAIQMAAVDAIATSGDIAALITNLKNSTPMLQAKIQTILLTRPNWTKSLLDELEKDELEKEVRESDQLSVNDLSPATRDVLSQHNDDEVRNRYTTLVSSLKVIDRSAMLKKYEMALTSTGDAGAGKKLFEKNCAACHQLGGIGQGVGPDLAGLQSKTPEYILSAILDPNRAIESKYRTYKIGTVDGRFFAGMILEESATSVKLALADGSSANILRSEIEAMQTSSRSFMPEGMEKSLTIEQMRDLLSFVHLNSSSDPQIGAANQKE